MGGIRVWLLSVIAVSSGVWIVLTAIKSRLAAAGISANRPQQHPKTSLLTKTVLPSNRRTFSHPLGNVPPQKSATVPHTSQVKAVGGITTQHNTNMAEIRGVFGYGKELIRRFGSDQCGSWAASLSFFAVLSIAPILLCGLALLGFFFQSADEAAKRILDIVSNFVPDRASAKALISQLNVKTAAATLIHSAPRAALIGILSLIWASLQIFVNAVPPMNAAFRAVETRNWLKLRLSALGLLLVTGVMFLCSLLPTSGVALINHFGAGHLPDPIPPLLAVFFFAIGLALNGATVAVIYKFLPSPSADVSWRASLIAAGIVAVLSEIAKQAFAIYLQRFANYNKVYGSLGGLIAIIFWSYYSSMILLLGAEIAKLYQDGYDYANHTKNNEADSRSLQQP